MLNKLCVAGFSYLAPLYKIACVQLTLRLVAKYISKHLIFKDSAFDECIPCSLDRKSI